MKAQPCRYSEDEVLAFVEGQLEGTDDLRMTEHLGQCEGCREQAAEFTALRSALPGCCADAAIRWHSFETSFGTMYVAGTGDGLARLSWRQPDPDAFIAEVEGRFAGRPVVPGQEQLAETERQLLEYFSGKRTRFELAVDLSALTAFERSVLASAREIPFGEVIAYSELARRIGRPRAARAVGNALGRNPVAIVVPCHRVVRRDGSLGGYGGGVEYKERLLAIEAAA